MSTTTTPTETPARIEIWKTLPAAMRCQGWTKQGTTSDRSMLREIKRDLEAKGITKIAFTRGAMDDVHYWSK
jgi:hypothetical protein